MTTTHEIEQQVLLTLLMYAHKQEELSVRLSAELFSHPAHQIIYRTMEHMYQAGQAIDMVTVAVSLQRQGVAPEVLSAFTAITTRPVGTTHFADHVLLLHEAWKERRVQAIANNILTTHDMPIDELIAHTEDALYQLSEKSMVREVKHVGEDIDGAISRIAKACEDNRPMTGLLTGYEQLDRITLGLQPSDLIILAARPSQGKTAFAIALALNIATAHPVGLFSLEMGREQIANRLLMQRSGVSGEAIRGGLLSVEQRLQVEAVSGELRNMPIYIDDTPSLNVHELRTKIRRLVRCQGVRLVIVDYLQLLTYPLGKNSTREQEVSKISRMLKSIAKEMNIPILALSQLNREIERGAEGREPRLADLRESGSIEQDADLVLMLHKPRLNADASERQLHIAKHRNGRTGQVLLHFANGRWG